MGSLLIVGLFIGMRHALEADHIAAVASLVSGKQTLTHTIRVGSAWGIGHTITLFLFGSMVIFLDTEIPEYFADALEMAVGIMLVLLGADVLRRVSSQKIHFHSHYHRNGSYHFHAHSHAGESDLQHNDLHHEHNHQQGFLRRALMIGMMHGMAGSAAVIILALGTVTSPLQGILYLLMFGIGSMLGMALLSVIISIPMHLSIQRLNWMHNGFQLMIGLITTGLGFFVIYDNSRFLISQFIS
ncbi:MAG: urease accessory protein [gamma proteobacterium symbiont of Bathyaustriella thionipta]|nr:urease accessory protein [gamma proteobacterium symbiont of Bathyaustriella thionipta]MCU7949377.1 urease accessory protein [gamma proteobacterium symbiont of Bathyaustriella thionipta]MCU7952137.1 urease accessory protein [gamma proteobacterium symbiont of Bathyaustriella thionipta]MCU7955950.1 urease accessory protein [gamma proteobacterium symbiont of Bathyaustriella thionipta]MCU7967888.1 urease accessory protein [gamma proteobacterium symbiont of Bathyaustriella thionipta]